MPKKPAMAECELHRTISIMSHVVKMYIRVMLRKKKKHPERCLKKVVPESESDTSSKFFIDIESK